MLRQSPGTAAAGSWCALPAPLPGLAAGRARRLLPRDPLLLQPEALAASRVLPLGHRAAAVFVLKKQDFAVSARQALEADVAGPAGQEEVLLRVALRRRGVRPEAACGRRRAAREPLQVDAASPQALNDAQIAALRVGGHD